MIDIPEDTLSLICEAFYSRQPKGQTVNGVMFTNIIRHNAINYTIAGTYDDGEQLWGFEIDDGDWGGTVVHQWCLEADLRPVEREEPPRYVLTPIDRLVHLKSSLKFRIFLSWIAQAEFVEKVRSYNYDRHFHPGVMVESHYKEWAQKKNLRWVLEDSFAELIAEFEKAELERD